MRWLLISLGVSAIGFLAIAEGYDRSRDQRPLPRSPITGKAIPPLPRLENPPLPVLTVHPEPSTKGETLDLHKKLAERLSNVKVVPEGRLRHFPWLNNGDFELQGWHGFIEKADPVPGGYLVVLRVNPIVHSSFGASTTILDHVREKYGVLNDRARCVEVIPSPVAERPSFITD